MNPADFLAPSETIDFAHPLVAAKAKALAGASADDEAVAKNCFLFVRDRIAHSGDSKAQIGTCTASEVLERGTGWCYAKSHLLAALLRANGIPAALCYQRLTCFEYGTETYCLHGLNAVYLKNHGWYRLDARGNKPGVNAQFTPPVEQLAFALGPNESDLPGLYAQPLDVVVEALRKYPTYETMCGHFDLTYSIESQRVFFQPL